MSELTEDEQRQIVEADGAWVALREAWEALGRAVVAELFCKHGRHKWIVGNVYQGSLGNGWWTTPECLWCGKQGQTRPATPTEEALGEGFSSEVPEGSRINYNSIPLIMGQGGRVRRRREAEEHDQAGPDRT